MQKSGNSMPGLLADRVLCVSIAVQFQTQRFATTRKFMTLHWFRNRVDYTSNMDERRRMSGKLNFPAQVPSRPARLFSINRSISTVCPPPSVVKFREFFWPDISREIFHTIFFRKWVFMYFTNFTKMLK